MAAVEKKLRERGRNMWGILSQNIDTILFTLECLFRDNFEIRHIPLLKQF